MTRDEAQALLRRHLNALNRHDVAALSGLYAEDAVLTSPMFDTVHGRAAIGRTFERLFALFPDYHVRLSDRDFIAEGDRAAEFSAVTGTHSVELFGLPPTGHQIEYHAARLFTFRAGQILTEQRIYDFGGVLERLEKIRIDRELTMASAVQQALLSRTEHLRGRFEAVGASVSCRAIGGDFLEYVDLPHDQLGVAVGDVSGKGPAAALVAAMLQGMFSVLAGDDPAPGSLLARLNRALCERRIEPRFATLLYARLSPDGRVTYSNAGHNPPFLLTRQSLRRLLQGGPPLGLFPDAEFPEETLPLGPGDILVACSDGVTETTSPQGEDFGGDRLAVSARANCALPPSALLRALFDEVRSFGVGAPPADDLTIAVVQAR